MRFMLLFAADEQEWLELPEAERDGAIRGIGEWFMRHAQAGTIVEGHRLSGAHAARTVRLGRAGRSSKPVVVDGPFVEGKEAIGSYAIVDVADEGAAIEVASSWPAGGSVEVRPLME
jgi:hypothetical protein